MVETITVPTITDLTSSLQKYKNVAKPAYICVWYIMPYTSGTYGVIKIDRWHKYLTSLKINEIKLFVNSFLYGV